MDFNSISKLENEAERVTKLYELFNEDARLNRSKAARIEFLTTTKYIEKYLKVGDKILDLGAGAGEYSLYFAKNGYDVTAVELADSNIKAFRKKITSDLKIDLRQGNACDLSCFESSSFDIVLVFGPLYHISAPNERQKCLDEAKRVCKPNGMIFVAYISNDFVYLTELNYDPHYMINGRYDRTSFKLEDFPFVFKTVTEARQELTNEVEIISEVATDGASELMAKVINSFNDEEYLNYLNYHYYCCEKHELLGMSSHLLFCCKNKTER